MTAILLQMEKNFFRSKDMASRCGVRTGWEEMDERGGRELRMKEIFMWQLYPCSHSQTSSTSCMLLTVYFTEIWLGNCESRNAGMRNGTRNGNNVVYFMEIWSGVSSALGLRVQHIQISVQVYVYITYYSRNSNLWLVFKPFNWIIAGWLNGRKLGNNLGMRLASSFSCLS